MCLVIKVRIAIGLAVDSGKLGGGGRTAVFEHVR